jgi:hypothetical protein
MGIMIEHTGTAGDMAVTTTAGENISADWVGIFELAQGGAYTGSMTITNNASISSLAGAPNTLDFGLFGENFGTGAVTVANSGAIGSSTDRIVQTGIGAEILKGAATSAVSVTGSGAIFAGFNGIFAENDGSGTTTVNYTGAVDTSGGVGVHAQAMAAMSRSRPAR